MRFVMKNDWEKVKNRINDLERTDRLDWKKISNRELNIIMENLHKRQNKHWYEPASYELARRKHLRLIIISGLTLLFAILGVIIGIFQYYNK